MNQSADVNRGALCERKVCVTGHLICLTHGELEELVQSQGGTFLRWPRKCGFTLVIGDDGWPSQEDGSPSQIFERARKLRALGYPIEFVSEDDFLNSIGLSQPVEAIRARHTISDLTRILDVSATTIRRWMQSGLIEPIDLECRLAYFDFHQVSNAKRICELLEAGASVAAIRHGIEQIRHWLPDDKLPLSQLAGLQRRTALFRRDGDLLDGSGQRHFDFDTAATSEFAFATTPASVFERADVCQLFDRALDLEDTGQFEQALTAYGRAIELDPTDPILHFNLGNVLYELDRLDDSAASYRRALEFDSNYAEAWNNLGNVLSVLSRFDDAVDAFQHALRLIPSYADAHHNLADLFARLGRTRESKQHREAYKKYSSADNHFAQRASFLRVLRDEADELNCL